jgi:hypothetical protein
MLGKTPNITAVCISRQQEAWHLSDIPFFCYTKKSKGPFPRERIRQRIEYYAELRNEATSEALKRYPGTEHVLSVESYYLNQPRAIRRLITSYGGESIVGAATWIWEKLRILRKANFYDTWATPEADGLRFHFVRPRGKMKVSSVGSCIVFPRSVWERVGYGVPDPFPEAGCEYNYLCARSGLPVWLNLDANLWRNPKTVEGILEYSWPKRIRCSLNLGRFASRE